MFIIFLLCNLFFVFYGKQLYKKWINPINIYAYIWVLAVSIHQSKLIFYYALSEKTWIVLLSAELIYVIGCLIGFFLSKRIKNNRKIVFNEQYSREMLKKIIIYFSVLSLTVIALQYIQLVTKYGFNIIAVIRQIYFDGLAGKGTERRFVLLADLVFIALPLAGYYITKYRFEKMVFLPIVAIIAMQLTSGARGSLVAGATLFAAPFLLKSAVIHVDKKKIMRSILLMIIFFLIITYVRGAGGPQKMPYASDFLKSISGKSATVYTILKYFSVPIGALNEYLESPTYYDWGMLTFRIFNKLLYKIGIIDHFSERTDFEIFYTPMETNVRTYLGDLIRDFHLFGALFVCFIIGFIFSYSYYRMIRYDSLGDTLICSVAFGVVLLSFFAWYMGFIMFWLPLLFAFFVKIMLGRKVKIVFKYRS